MAAQPVAMGEPHRHELPSVLRPSSRLIREGGIKFPRFGFKGSDPLKAGFKGSEPLKPLQNPKPTPRLT